MRRVVPLLVVAGLATAAVAWQNSVNQLQQDGKTISTNLKVVGGTLMVPVKDVAAYLGGTLTVQNGTATISTTQTTSNAGDVVAPNAIPNPVASANLGTLVQGQSQTLIPEAKAPEPKELKVKVGEVADDDGFAFKVLSVDDLVKNRTYRTEYDPRGRKISPGLKDDRLVVVRMRLENRTSETRRPPLPSSSDVTLFDETNVGTPAIAYDARPVGLPDDTDSLDAYTGFDTLDAPVLAPKGAFEFAAIFSLSKQRGPKRLSIALPSASTNGGGANVTVDLGG